MASIISAPQHKLGTETKRRNGESPSRIHGKTQEVEWLFHILVNRLILSDEYIILYRNLFLHAIKWYKRHVSCEKPWTAQYLDDTDLSLLPHLENTVRNGKQIEGDMAKLLSTIVKGYCNFVQELEKEPWVDRKAVEDELGQLESIAKDTLLRDIGKPRTP